MQSRATPTAYARAHAGQRQQRRRRRRRGSRAATWSIASHAQVHILLRCRCWRRGARISKADMNVPAPAGCAQAHARHFHGGATCHTSEAARPRHLSCIARAAARLLSSSASSACQGRLEDGFYSILRIRYACSLSHFSFTQARGRKGQLALRIVSEGLLQCFS
jgi:hypothetical protein